MAKAVEEGAWEQPYSADAFNLLSGDPELNPRFASFNRVYLPYCSMVETLGTIRQPHCLHMGWTCGVHTWPLAFAYRGHPAKRYTTGTHACSPSNISCAPAPAPTPPPHPPTHHQECHTGQGPRHLQQSPQSTSSLAPYLSSSYPPSQPGPHRTCGRGTWKSLDGTSTTSRAIASSRWGSPWQGAGGLCGEGVVVVVVLQQHTVGVCCACRAWLGSSKVGRSAVTA